MSDISADAANLNPSALQDNNFSLTINAQYLRDLSFENPRAPESLLQPQAAPPDISVDVDVKARQVGPEAYEVVLGLKVTASSADSPLFVVEIDYGAVVTIRNAPEDYLGLLIVVETPRLLFPFARAIIADATRDGGYPAL
ncbi:MAG TPA: protein-export chaperone SecB, partial [Stellaceae bacterium]|nr:protein-export chaperone SecB [Stellaceae bacterium]